MQVQLFHPDQGPPVAPVRAVVDRYLAHATAQGKFCAAAMAERQFTLGAFADHMATRALEDCIGDHLAEWIDGHTSWKSLHTRRAKANQVNACFNWARDVGRIKVNPFAAVRYDEGERRPPTTDAALGKILRLSDAGFRRFLLFLRDVGCRPGEAREILWDEIDWDLGAVVKLRHKTRKKTKRSRVIPLTTSILAMLRWMRERCDGSGEVFRTNRGDPWTKSALVQKWDRLRKKAGVPKVLCLHGIRHQFGTAAVKGGGNVKLISLAMGHSSVSTTERYYLHLDGELEAMKREMAKGKRS